MTAAVRQSHVRATGQLQRLVKQLRDGAANPDQTAAAIVSTRRLVKYSAIVRICHDLARVGWTGTVASGTEDDLLRLVGAFREEPIAVASGAPPAIAVAAEPASRKVDVPNTSITTGRARAPRFFATVSVAEVVAAHQALVREFRRSRDPIDPPGVKSMDLLESAASRQHTSYGGSDKYKTLPHLGAALFFGLALNHPFHNGNKRTALLALVWLLDKNSYVITAGEADLYEFVLKVVEHRFRPDSELSASVLADMEVREMASWITAHIRRVDRHLHPVDWRELKKHLRDVGCRIGDPDKNFIDIFRGEKRLRLAYGGDDREVTKATIRKIMRELGLDETAVFDEAEFYGKAAGVDRFILQYRDVLGRLAHA